MDTESSADFDLAGLIDCHIHTAPDIVPRLADDLDVARAAATAGMRAVVLKSHVCQTAGRAAVAERCVGGIRVFGGLALNTPVGGLNPGAVEVALRLGGKVIWMPTRDAESEHRRKGRPGGLSIFGPERQIRREVFEIIDLIADADAILATGHLAVEESVALIHVAHERHVRKIVVTHPESPSVRMPVALQESLARDVFFERCLLATTPAVRERVTLEEIAGQIRRVGVASTVLATDFGQTTNPPPVAGLRRYLQGLQSLGFEVEELRTMAGDTPAALLDLR